VDDHEKAHRDLDELLHKIPVADASKVKEGFVDLEKRVTALEQRIAELGNSEDDVPPSIIPNL
jgi:polyhydroxyalkanoate synthesis regulator phasin